jgi:3-oxoacyl-[acyl-carrier-protein] synthase-1
MSKKIFVTGIGIISSIGNGVAETLKFVESSSSGIGTINNLITFYKDKLPAAEVKLTNKELANIAGISEDKLYTRTTLLGVIAAREALKSSGININEMRNGLISATSVGGMDQSEHFYDAFYADDSNGDLAQISGHDCYDSSEKIARELGIKDYITTISTACSSSANSIMFGARLIKNNIVDRVVAGGTDSITRFTLNGFNTLMILDKDGCKPFDEKRNGLTIGEGAGYIVLESEESVLKSGSKILCELTGYGNANDAYHQTASSPEGNGAYLAMSKAIKLSGLDISDIDYINVHGTGTQNNDLSEGVAMKRVFGDNMPSFSSTKSFTGHTLGACGGIEAVFSALAIDKSLIYPNLNFSEEIAELGISPVKELIRNAKVNNVLSNSFGFGGNNSTLIFSKVK